MEMKICGKCGIEKPKTEEYFYFRKFESRYAGPCRDCARKYKREYHLKNLSLNRKKSDSEIFDGTIKKCCSCKQEKLKTRDFWRRANTKFDGISDVCKECDNSNKKKTYKNDVFYKLRRLISKAILKALKKLGKSKNNSSILEHFSTGYIEKLKGHIDVLLKDHPDWSWENHGIVWHIDHIYPQSKLPYGSMDHPNFLKCWDISNIQILSVEDNLRKSNKIEQMKS